jgi:sec-independent protein translocase protein TatC
VSEPEEPASSSPDFLDDEEEGGGPVKTFLEHLEDLRWMLIKSVSAILVAMMVCLVAGDKLVQLLTWPLRVAQRSQAVSHPSVTFRFGTNVLWKLPRKDLDPSLLGTNTAAHFQVHLQPAGTNWTLTFEPDLTPAAAAAISAGTVLKNYSPIGAFIVALKLALYGGLVLAAPFVFYFVGEFVIPALKVREREWLYRASMLGSVLFLMGVAFCYFIIVRVALLASVGFSQWMGFGADEWRAEDYIGFVCKFMLGMGLSFELPVVILTLVKLGLLDVAKLSRFRAYWVVIELVISAVATPSGDPVTMVLMALPLHALYEMSLLVAWVWERRDRRAAAAGAAGAASDNDGGA